MKINFTFSTLETEINGGFSQGDLKNFNIGFAENIIINAVPDGFSVYEGEYSVTPQITAQTLETENKLMTDDLTIKAIPYFEVSNLAGGSTVTIGNMND